MAEEKKRRYTEAQNRATQRYIRENLEEIKFRVRKGEKDRYKAAAEKTGMSMAKFFLTAADEKMSHVTRESPQEAAGQPAGAGGISLSPDALEAAEKAAGLTGEDVSGFIRRAVETQAQRDKSSFYMGVNPATGEKLKGEA